MTTDGHKEGQLNMGPVITYGKNIQQGGVDLSVTSVSNGVDVTYGDWTKQNGTGTTTKKSNVTFNVRYTGISHVLNSDNSITVNLTLTVGTFTRTVVATDYNRDVHVRDWIDGQIYWNFTEPVITASSHAGHSKSFSVTVPPLGTSWLASVRFLNDMIEASPDDEFYVGMKIYNPNPPDYRPGQDRVSGVWESHNRGSGKADIRTSGSWTTMRTQTGTGNPPLIYKSGSWVNQAKIGANQ